jgi:hypothetical protein
VIAPPSVDVEQVGADDTGDRGGEAGKSDADHQPLQPVRRRERLHQIQNAQCGQAGAAHAGNRPNRQRGSEIVDQEVGERGRHEHCQDDLGEQPQAILHAELDQQQVHAGVGHHEDDRQPCSL